MPHPAPSLYAAPSSLSFCRTQLPLYVLHPAPSPYVHWLEDQRCCAVLSRLSVATTLRLDDEIYAR